MGYIKENLHLRKVMQMKSNEDEKEQLLLKKQIFKAWSGILLSKSLINSSKYAQMLSVIEKMTK